MLLLNLGEKQADGLFDLLEKFAGPRFRVHNDAELRAELSEWLGA